MNSDWCFEPLKKYGGYIQTEEEYKEVMKIVEENLHKLHKDENEDKIITIHNSLLEEKDKEIERLNNIINELEKYLETEKDNHSNSWHYREWIRQVFNKLKALKEGK